MNLNHIVILALVQGITEFLPISSSAHLILSGQILGWPDQGLAFDVAVHFGTLFAVMFYFRKELIPLSIGFFKSNDHSKLSRGIVIATIPCALAGFIFSDAIEQNLRSAQIIVIATLIFGILLGIADWYDSRLSTKKELSFRKMLLIGLSQILALIPGTSRSGITMTTGLFLGLSRTDASRFSFLLSIPIIALAAGYEGLKLLMSPNAVIWSDLWVAMIVSMLSAYVCMSLFLKLIERIGFWPFVLYRIVLAFVLQYWLY